jgi:tetratricopeptide (TPR) repeat protein
MPSTLKSLKPIPLPDQRHLDAAEGWLGLGDHLAANEELEQISASLRAHSVVLEVRYKIYAEAKKWDGAVEIAQTMAKLMPDNPWGPFYLAFSLHELKRTQEAYKTLKPVVDKFPDHYLMRYNLACYSCQLGKLKEAMEWLEKAIDLAVKMDIRTMALDDPDLEPLWQKIGRFEEYTELRINELSGSTP